MTGTREVESVDIREGSYVAARTGRPKGDVEAKRIRFVLEAGAAPAKGLQVVRQAE